MKEQVKILDSRFSGIYQAQMVKKGVFLYTTKLHRAYAFAFSAFFHLRGLCVKVISREERKVFRKGRNRKRSDIIFSPISN